MRTLASLRRFGRDRSGTVAILAAASAAILMAASAIGIDGSRLYLLRRQQQSMTDLAAMSAAMNLGSALTAAGQSLSGNNVAASLLKSVETGIYLQDVNLLADQRFSLAAVGSANAARVKMQSQAYGIFGAFLAPNGFTISTQAVAASANVADLALAPPLAGIDPLIANGLLGSMIGGAVNLNTNDYLGLAALNLDLFAFADAVGARTGFHGTYSDLTKAAVRLSDVFAAVADVLSSAGAPQSATATLRFLATATGSAGPKLAFGNLIGFNAYGNRTIGAGAPIAASLPVLPLVLAAARLAAATVGNVVSTTVTGLASGLAGLKLGLATKVPDAGSSFAAIGPTGTAVHTLQTRASLTLQLPGADILPALNLTLYLQSQSATGRIASISGASAANATVTLGVVPGLSDAWIGSASDADLTDWSDTPQPSAATLLNTPLVKITAFAHYSSGSAQETLQTFAASDITACKTQTMTGNTFVQPLLNLFSSLQVQVTILGFGFGTQSGILSSVTRVLQAAVQPVAASVDSALTFLGLTTNDIGSWVCAVRPGQVALVK